MRRVKGNSLGYLGNSNVKRDGVEQSFSEDEVKEYARCMSDPAYFIENYMKVIHPDHGLVPFKPYRYQKKMFKHFNDNRFSIILACRQSGKSISSVGYILWYALFHPEKTVAILANKGATAREMLSRLTLALENIPFFLQPGCRALNKGNIEFSNNSEIVATATSTSSIRGLSINLRFLEEFAFVERANKFYESTYPVITAGKTTKVIITSTMNGIGNMFYNLWEGAIHGSNGFKPFRVDWWDVPGRDEEWKRETIANTSQLQFNQEFGNTALGLSGTLIAADKLIALASRDPVEYNSDVGLRFYEKPQEGHQYIMAVDTGQGRGQDYSAFSVIDVTTRPFRQVCTLRNNMISPLLFPDIVVQVAMLYNEALLVIENNDVGQVVCNGVYYDHEYENTFVESSVRRGGVGLGMNKKTKRIGCSNLKDLIEMGKLEVYDAETIIELTCFSEKGSSYEATEGNHDDMVMTLVIFSWFASSEAFGDFFDADLDFKNMLYAERSKEIENDLIPAGFFPTSDPVLDGYAELVQQRQEWDAL
jgi:hypothetical protein